MAKNIANMIDTFVDAVKALNKFKVTAGKKLNTLRTSIKDAAWEVFNAGGTWKDCNNALTDTDIDFKQQTLEKYFIDWKVENGIEKKQNKGNENPNAEPAIQALRAELPDGYPSSENEAVKAGQAYTEPMVRAAIKSAHTKDNPCYVGKKASDLDKQIALANLQHACVKGFRSSSTAIAKSGKNASSVAATMREDLKSTNPKTPAKNTRNKSKKVTA